MGKEEEGTLGCIAGSAPLNPTLLAVGEASHHNGCQEMPYHAQRDNVLKQSNSQLALGVKRNGMFGASLAAVSTPDLAALLLRWAALEVTPLSPVLGGGQGKRERSHSLGRIQSLPGA